MFFSQENHGILCQFLRGGSKGCSEDFRRDALCHAIYCQRADGQTVHFYGDTEVLGELERIIYTYIEKNTDRKFKSLEILNNNELKSKCGKNTR